MVRIFISGARIGVQFNRKSLGKRVVSRKVHEKDGIQYIEFGGNKIAVEPPSGEFAQYSPYAFEAVRVIAQ